MVSRHQHERRRPINRQYNSPKQRLYPPFAVLIVHSDTWEYGALFGPVVAAAVILPTRTSSLARLGLKDSKQLTREQRELLDRKIRKLAIAIAIAEVDAETIDRVNIYQASRLAMLLAVQRLPVAPDHLLIDAMYIDLSQLAHPCAQTRLFYGDALSLSIAAASVVAKVHRDALMRDLDVLHPQYGLASHKGYATAEHRRALAQHGPCPLHRKTCSSIRKASPGLGDIEGHGQESG